MISLIGSTQREKKPSLLFFVVYVPSPVARSGLLGQGDGGVDEGERVGHASADVVEVSADEEVVIARLHGGVSNELELEGELVSRVNLEVVSEASQLERGFECGTERKGGRWGEKVSFRSRNEKRALLAPGGSFSSCLSVQTTSLLA